MKLNKKLIFMMTTLAIVGLSLVGCGQKHTENKVESTITIEEGSVENTDEQPADKEEVVEQEEEAAEQVEEEVVEQVEEEGYIGEKDPTPSDEIYFTVTNGLEEMASMTADEAMLKDAYGIDSELLSSYRVEMGMNRARVSELAVFELKDEKDIDKVKEGIAKRQQDLEKQWESYLEDQYELVKNSQIIVKGNIILYVVSLDADQIVEQFDMI